MLHPAVPFFRSATRAARRLPLEAWVWTAGLLALAATDPAEPGLLDVCGFELLGVLGALGLERGPGCGLGHSVAFLLEGQLAPALQAHPLGPLALAVLAGRVATLAREALRPPAAPAPPPTSAP